MHGTGSNAPSAAGGSAAAQAQDRRRSKRLQLMAATRRAHVLAAARDAFVELGLEGASLREIARRAGYSPGALYSYFGSKEEVYAALLGDSLQRLNAAVAAAPVAPGAAERLRGKALAFFGFYLEHPRDLDLGFYLLRGLSPRALDQALDDELDAGLRQALAPCGQALLDLGLDAATALSETTALLAHMAGVLLLGRHGRIRMFGQQPLDLMQRHLEHLLQRTTRGKAPRKVKP